MIRDLRERCAVIFSITLLSDQLDMPWRLSNRLRFPSFATVNEMEKINIKISCPIWLLKDAFNIKVLHLLHLHIAWNTVSTQAIGSFLYLQKIRLAGVKKCMSPPDRQLREREREGGWREHFAISSLNTLNKELTLEMAMAVSAQAFFGLLIIEPTFKSRSISAIFWDFHFPPKKVRFMNLQHIVCIFINALPV